MERINGFFNINPKNNLEKEFDEAIKNNDTQKALEIAIMLYIEKKQTKYLKGMLIEFVPSLQNNKKALKGAEESIKSGFFINVPKILEENGFGEEEIKEGAKFAALCYMYLGKDDIAKYDIAIDIAKKYDVPKELIKEAYKRTFEKLRSVAPVKAFYIAVEGGLGKEAIQEVALEAFVLAIRERDFKKIYEILTIAGRDSISKEEIEQTMTTLRKAFNEFQPRT
jgi:Fe-S cluster assembly iron-binding protein IscA